MKVLVTGGAGFMGSWIAKEHLKRGDEVLIIDDLSGGSHENIPQGASARFFDLRDAEKTEDAFQSFKPEVVHHAACHPHEGLSQFMPLDIGTSVFTASVSVFKAAVNCGVRRIVYFSSMARYGDAGGAHPPFHEWDVTTPKDVYGGAKLAAEHALKAMAEAHGFEYVILVPHNVTGRFQCLRDAYRNVLAIWSNRLLKGKPPLVYGDGLQERAISDIRDSLPCYIKAAIDDAPVGEVINIGGNEVHTIKDLAYMVIDAFDIGIEPVFVEERPCEVKKAYCSIEKSEKLLGFKQEHTVRETIEDFVEWVKEVGYQKPKYIQKDKIEIVHNMPRVWREELI